MAEERMTSKIAQVAITVTGVWEDQEGNPYVHERKFLTSIDTEDVTTFEHFNERAEDVAQFLIDHPKVCTAIMDNNS